MSACEAVETQPENEVYVCSRNRMSSQEHIMQIERDIFTKASLTTAKRFREMNSLRKNDNGNIRKYNICCSSTVHFADYSLGLRLHFTLIKQLILIFFVIAGVSVLPLYLNYNGNYYLPSQVQSEMDFFTIGNQGSRPGEEKDSSEIEDNYLMIYISDTCCAGFFILMILIFFIVGNVKIINSLKNTHKISNFSVEIQGLPSKKVTEDEVKKHFSQFGKVAEVFLSRKFGSMLYIHTQRAELQEQIFLLESLDKMNKRDPKNNKKLEKLIKKKTKFDEVISKSDTSISYESLDIKNAYIVFNKQSDRRNCLNAYNRKNCCGCSLQKKEHRFRGKFKLSAFPAKEPSDIIWENIEVSSCSRFLRTCLSIILTFFILLASMGMIYYVKTSQSDLPTQQECLPYNEDTINIQDYPKDSTATFCYCQNLSTDSLISESTDKCSTYIGELSHAWGMKFLSSFGIILMNYFVKIIMRKLSSFERPKSQTDIQRKIFKKIFILIFINTAILTFLVNLNFPQLSEYIFHGKYKDFEKEWFLKVGSLILILMIISMGSPHLIYLGIAYPLGWCCRKNCYKSKKSQYELNMMFLGPEFDIASRTAQILSVVFTCYFYSGGIPLLNCTCFIYLVIIFMTDKFLVLRHYKKPPYYTHEIYVTALFLLPWAVIFHCLVALFMFGNTEIFYIDTEENEKIRRFFGDIFGRRIEKPAGIVFFALILAGLLLVITLGFIQLICEIIITKILNKKVKDVKFTSVRREIRRTGLGTYDIRSNPNYAMIVMSMLNSDEDSKRFIDEAQENSNSEKD
ncbi:hypothetical protein SteCoe_23325 [Stentor coeruleus]|uniref:RRM domain-containing protein n=1 Tax=Stentor coeruleus TaxID=5963 RepID=A0A1R2BK41_9CILI|nr:hypothetical protein SteCoe_23325 [Stentor coeruleus]